MRPKNVPSPSVAASFLISPVRADCSMPVHRTSSKAAASMRCAGAKMTLALRRQLHPVDVTRQQSVVPRDRIPVCRGRGAGALTDWPSASAAARKLPARDFQENARAFPIELASPPRARTFLLRNNTFLFRRHTTALSAIIFSAIWAPGSADCNSNRIAASGSEHTGNWAPGGFSARRRSRALPFDRTAPPE